MSIYGQKGFNQTHRLKESTSLVFTKIYAIITYIEKWNVIHFDYWKTKFFNNFSERLQKTHSIIFPKLGFYKTKRWKLFAVPQMTAL